MNLKLAVLFFSLLIDVLGIGIMLPVMPGLVRDLNGGDISSAAVIYGWLIALYSLMQFVFGPAVGALSDRFGRRPILLCSMLGLGLDYLLLAVAPNLWVVALARIVGGIMGASISTATAYVADVTPPERRAQNFGIIGVAFGVGFVVGPVVGGFLGEYGPRVPFYAAAGVSLVAFIFALFLLPESLDRAHRRPFRFKEANPIGAFFVIARYRTVISLLIVFVLSQLAERLLESTWVLFTSYQFGWGAAQVGLSFAWVGVLFVCTQGVLVRYAVPRFGEWPTVIFGLAVATVCMSMLAFVTQGWMLYAVTVPYILGWGMTGPAAQSIVTSAVPSNEQGILQGAISSVSTATGVVAPPIGGALFGYFISDAAPFHLPGIAFLLGALMFVSALLLAWRPAVHAVADRAAAARAAAEAAE
jgi:DHA1 family tetracycline resistance protein-like MFS transporter